MPPTWVTLQVVASWGPSPLPAIVRILNHPNDAVQKMYFYLDRAKAVDNAICTDDRLRMVPKEYSQANNPLLYEFRRFLTICEAKTLGLLQYQYNDIAELCVPEYPKPHEAMYDDIVEIVEQEVSSLSDALQHIVNVQITTGEIAQLCLDLTEAVRVNKNWNSHGSRVGAAMSSLAQLIVTVEHGVPNNWRQIKPRGHVLTGGQHGSSDNVYTEYMVTWYEENLHGGTEPYLEETRFSLGNHDKAVANVFSETMPDRQFPAPRPTRAHTFDFCCKCKGVHLLDGECKADEDGRDVLLLHAAHQFAYKDTALSLHTTNKSMTLFKCILDTDRRRIAICTQTMQKFALRCPIGVVDADRDDPVIFQPPMPGTGGPAPAWWSNIRSEARFYAKSIFETIDYLVTEFDAVNVDQAVGQRTVNYQAGFKEPCYWYGARADRKIKDQDRFKFCAETMRLYQDLNAKRQHSRSMVRLLTKTMNLNPQMNDSLRDQLNDLLQEHKENLK